MHPEVVTKFLQEELVKHRMLGPFPQSMRSINRFGVIPKSTLGKFHPITDLSFS